MCDENLGFTLTGTTCAQTKCAKNKFGTYSSSSPTSCTACDPACSECKSAVKTTANGDCVCNSGMKYFEITGTCTLVGCVAAGNFRAGSACTNCDTGCAECTGTGLSTNCETCDNGLGFYENNANACEKTVCE